MNFYMPDHLRRPSIGSQATWREEVLTELEAFWDSEAPRVGEEGAVGWRKTEIDVAVPPPPPSVGPSSTGLSTGDDVFENWIRNERYRALATGRPGRASDPEAEDSEDPFHVVFFTDLRPFLFIVDSPIVKTQIIYAFLILLGLPLTPPDASTSSAFSTDPFLHSEIIEKPNARRNFWPKLQIAPRPYDTIGGEPMEPRRESGMANPFGSPFKAFPMAPELLFSTEPKWFSFFEKDDLEGVDVDFVKLVASTAFMCVS
jgi:hypothetical protein